MLSPAESRHALVKLFRRRRIADLPLLCHTLQTQSRMSVFRRLSDVGYLSSYNHTGRYYTLASGPDFDADGLWRFQGIFFSVRGSLKKATEHLVASAEAGYTQQELQLRLRVRVHNTLLDLVRSKRIHREPLEDCYVYVSRRPRRASSQLAQRRRLLAASPPPQTAETRHLVLEVLLEVIHGARVVADPAAVAARLVHRGIQATPLQVEAIFRTHGLKKTPRSPSPS